MSTALRVFFCIAGVIVILIGVAMVRDDSVRYNRYGTAIPSHVPGAVTIAFGGILIVGAFRRVPPKS